MLRHAFGAASGHRLPASSPQTQRDARRSRRFASRHFRRAVRRSNSARASSQVRKEETPLRFVPENLQCSPNEAKRNQTPPGKEPASKPDRVVLTHVVPPCSSRYPLPEPVLIPIPLHIHESEFADLGLAIETGSLTEFRAHGRGSPSNCGCGLRSLTVPSPVPSLSPPHPAQRVSRTAVAL